MVAKEHDGMWQLPGGGLECGANPQAELAREIHEEMGLNVSSVASEPASLLTAKNRLNCWTANVLYEATLEHLNFTPSDECIAIQFVSKEEARALEAFENVHALADMFNPQLHMKPQV